jgi:hypothetical protein
MIPLPVEPLLSTRMIGLGEEGPVPDASLLPLLNASRPALEVEEEVELVLCRPAAPALPPPDALSVLVLRSRDDRMLSAEFIRADLQCL